MRWDQPLGDTREASVLGEAETNKQAWHMSSQVELEGGDGLVPEAWVPGTAKEPCPHIQDPRASLRLLAEAGCSGHGTARDHREPFLPPRSPRPVAMRVALHAGGVTENYTEYSG